jgi:hypothetical protein
VWSEVTPAGANGAPAAPLDSGAWETDIGWAPDIAAPGNADVTIDVTVGELSVAGGTLSEVACGVAPIEGITTSGLVCGAAVIAVDCRAGRRDGGGAFGGARFAAGAVMAIGINVTRSTDSRSRDRLDGRPDVIATSAAAKKRTVRATDSPNARQFGDGSRETSSKRLMRVEPID